MYKQLPPPKWNEKQGRWVLSVMIDRQRKQFTSQKPKAAGKREVIDRALTWLESLDGDKSQVCFSEAWELFITDYIKRKGENEQLIQLRSIGALYALPALSNIQCGKITVELLQAVINDARPHRKDKTKLSKKYLGNIKGVLTSFCRWATPRGYLKTDPSPLLYVPRSAETIGRTILQISDIEKLFSHRLGFWYERALLLEVLTGLRPGEVIGLKISDINNGVLHVRRSINARKQITQGKNKNATRCINLPQQANALVLEQIDMIKQLVANSDGWLFPNKLGGQPTQTQLRRTWARMVKAHGLPESSTPYSLRHTFYTHTEAYLPDRIIKTVFGHSSATDSHKLYGDHLIDGELTEARNRLEVTPLYNAAK